MIVAKDKIIEIMDSRLTLFILGSFVVCLLGAYVYLVNSSVFNIVAREEAMERGSVYATELSVLESRYIELSGNITLPLAYTLGFSDASNKSAFVRESESARFSLAANEI